MSRSELLDRVEVDLRKRWDLDRFKVVEMRHHTTWWGGRRRTLVVDVGWERARLGLLVRVRDGRVFRRRYPWSGGPMRATHEGDAFRIVANPDRLGSNATFLVDDRTGAVLSRAFHTR